MQQMGISNMNFNVWFDIPSKYIENFRAIVSVALGIFSERLTDTSCQDFSLWFCGISLAMGTTDVKSVCWRVSFSRPGLPFFLFLYLCQSPTTCYSQVLFLKQEVVHCVLSFWLVFVMLRSYMLILFQYLWISFQTEPEMTLCYHCMQTLELVQTKNSMSSHPVRFSPGVLNLV